MAQAVWPYSVSRVITPTIPTGRVAPNSSGGASRYLAPTPVNPAAIQNRATGTPDKSGLVTVKTVTGEYVTLDTGEPAGLLGMSHRTWLYMGAAAAVASVVLMMKPSKRLKEQAP